jgi:phosphonate transport system ATP-binding protein
LIDISQSTRKTLVVSLHSVDLALAYFPRVIGIKEGNKAFDLSPAQINDDMLEDLYSGRFRDDAVTEATNERLQSVTYPSVG